MTQTESQPEDYAWKFESAVSKTQTADDWLRATWETESPVLARVLPIAWKYGLGLRLGGFTSDQSILGWPIVDNNATKISVQAQSPLLLAENTVTTQENIVCWTTRVWYKNSLGKTLWVLAKPVHQMIIPIMLRAADQSS